MVEVNLIIFGVVLILLVIWLRNSEGPVAVVLAGWCRQAWRSFVGPNGYLVIVTLLGAYVGLFSIMESRHERRMNGAIIERTMFMNMASSGNSASFIAAMKSFGPLQNIEVPKEPEILVFWRWFEVEKPNKTPLYRWARGYLHECVPERCGNLGNPESGIKGNRINLREANLGRADLTGANLRGAELRGAELVEANLGEATLWGANLWGANLRGADLQKAYLREANLRGADLRGADLRGADLWVADLQKANLTEADLGEANLKDTKNLTQAQIDQACVDKKTELPAGLKKPEKILSLKDCRAKLEAEQKKKK